MINGSRTQQNTWLPCFSIYYDLFCPENSKVSRNIRLFHTQAFNDRAGRQFPIASCSRIAIRVGWANARKTPL